ncbi:restriction endonuclease subunit S [Empedobacter falsenii]
MMENRGWKEVKLEELIKFGNGKQRPDAEGLIPVYGGNGILSYTNSSNYDGETLIIGRVGAYCGAVYYDNRPIWISDNALSGKPKDNYDTKFLYYFLKNLDLNQFAGGSSHPLVTQTLLNSLESKVCINHNEQKAIASVLSSLDDKIDLLHQQNQTLEALAETLFRQWFIEEAKEDWEEVKLGDLVDIFNGVSYKSDDLNPSTTAMVTLKSFERNGGFRMDGFKEYTGKYKETHVVEEGDLVVAHTDITQDAALIGNPVLVKSHSNYDKLVISMDLVKVVSNNSNFTNEFLYLLMKTREFKEHALGYSNGSTVLHLSKKAIPEFELKLPPNELVNSFTKRVSPLIKKQFVNQNQIQTLTQLRDTLLPKLMSGEVRVKV